MTVFELSPNELRRYDVARLGYFSKLTHHQVWVPRPLRPPTHQTVIIFDWDDTLLCTSWLDTYCKENRGWFGTKATLPSDVMGHVRGIEREVSRILQIAG